MLLRSILKYHFWTLDYRKVEKKKIILIAYRPIGSRETSKLSSQSGTLKNYRLARPDRSICEEKKNSRPVYTRLTLKIYRLESSARSDYARRKIKNFVPNDRRKIFSQSGTLTNFRQIFFFRSVYTLWTPSIIYLQSFQARSVHTRRERRIPYSDRSIAEGLWKFFVSRCPIGL